MTRRFIRPLETSDLSPYMLTVQITPFESKAPTEEMLAGASMRKCERGLDSSRDDDRATEILRMTAAEHSTHSTIRVEGEAKISWIVSRPTR